MNAENIVLHSILNLQPYYDTVLVFFSKSQVKHFYICRDRCVKTDGEYK